MLPLVARSTQEVLRLVPAALREASDALGVDRWRSIITVVLPAALGGILTGSILAIARAAGETAPLLFTAATTFQTTGDLGQFMNSLPVQIYAYALSAYDDWHRQAWAGALVLVGVVFAFSVLARVVTRRLERMHRT